jgi:hypothetical protein
MKARLAAAGCALVVSACASSISVPVASPSPRDLGQDSPAANLRVHTELLFGEHVFVLSKLAIVAAAGRKDEFHAYAGMLASNATDVGTVFRLAFGETGGQQVGDAWSAGDNLYVNYLVGAVTQDSQMSDSAFQGLTGTYVPQLAGAIASNAGLTQDQATQLANGQVLAIKLVVDDAVAGAFPKLYTDVVSAHTNAIGFADTVTSQVTQKYPDRFPGDANRKAPSFRSAMNALFQRQAYLTTMLTDATSGTAQAEQAAAADILARNSAAISSTFGAIFGEASAQALASVWQQESRLVVAYATRGDTSSRQAVLDAAAAQPSGPYTPDLTAAFKSIVQTVDDQRANSSDVLANDDRAAAVEFSVAADEVTETAVSFAPAKFA